MKDLIKKILKEDTKDEYILEIPNLRFIPNVNLESAEGMTDAWNELLRLLKGKPFMFDDDLYLGGTKITSLGNLQSVGGDLSLYACEKLTSLGDVKSVVGNLNLRLCYKLTSLGNLRSVGGSLHLFDCINLSSLGDLQSVGGDLDLYETPISKKYSEEEIRQMVDVKGEIYF
jgi:hypothetical protein